MNFKDLNINLKPQKSLNTGSNLIGLNDVFVNLDIKGKGNRRVNKQMGIHQTKKASVQ